MSSQYDTIYSVARNLSWSIDEKDIQRNGPVFIKNLKYIWKIRYGWQCADLIAGHFKNHRQYDNVISALEQEA